jgi:proline iminopeptidase
MSDGASLFVKVAGHGPVCLFVHGGPGQDTLSFEQMGGSALEPFLTMVYVDQRGSGKSAEATDYHLDRIARDFDEVRRALAVDRVCLIAHSFGGVLALAYVRRYPEHVSQLVLANATLQFLGPYQRRMQTAFINNLLHRQVPLPPADADADAVAAAHEDAYRALMHEPLGYRLLTESLATVQRMNQLEDYPRSQGFGEAVMHRRAEFPEYWADYAPVTAEVATPVLVITSRKDYAVGPDEYKRFHFPHQTVAVLDTGHISYYDASPAFVAAIRDFITGHKP